MGGTSKSSLWFWNTHKKGKGKSMLESLASRLFIFLLLKGFRSVYVSFLFVCFCFCNSNFYFADYLWEIIYISIFASLKGDVINVIKVYVNTSENIPGLVCIRKKNIFYLNHHSVSVLFQSSVVRIFSGCTNKFGGFFFVWLVFVCVKLSKFKQSLAPWNFAYLHWCGAGLNQPFYRSTAVQSALHSRFSMQ